MTEQGYIKLHRSIMSWEWYQDSKTKDVFLHLLLNAQWEDSRFQGYEVPKGSLVTSYRKLAKSIGISVQSVRTSLNHLKSTHEITIKSTNKFIIISVENWAKFQCFDEVANTQTNRQSNIQLTNNQQTTNNIKEYKEYKEYKKNISGNDLYKMGMSGNYDFDELERETRNGS